MTAHVDLLKTLLPPVSYDPAAPGLAAQLDAEGAALDDALGAAQRVLAAITPDGDAELLSDWERVYGLPDTCLSNVDSSISLRIQAALRKIRRAGSLSRQFFIDLAGEFGYAITIDEFSPHTVVSTVAEPLRDEDWFFYWQVNMATAIPPRDFTVVDAVNTPLTVFQDGVLECLLNRLKPAHTQLLFNYI